MSRPAATAAALVLSASLMAPPVGASTNTVPTSYLLVRKTTISPADLRPPECVNVTVTALVRGSGNFDGANVSELILGSSVKDTVNARNGDDCVVGGGGNDSLNGGPGNDVCIGGPGNDTFSNCETRIDP